VEVPRVNQSAEAPSQPEFAPALQRTLGQGARCENENKSYKKVKNWYVQLSLSFENLKVLFFRFQSLEKQH
jgi:hypothetical protein